MLGKLTLVASLVALGVGGVHSEGLAAPVLDQSNTGAQTSPTTFGRNQTFTKGQSFTVGLSGTLAQIDVNLSSGTSFSLPVRLEIETTSGGLLTGAVLASASIPQASVVDGFNSCDISASGVAVKPGDVLAIVLTSDDANLHGLDYGLDNSGSALYAGGAALNKSAGVWSENASFDVRFRTLVEPLSGNVWGGANWGQLVWGGLQAVPTAHAVGLLALSMLLVGAAAHLTRRNDTVGSTCPDD